MSDRFAEAELVLDDELMYDDAPRRSTMLRREGVRAEEIVREGELLAGKYRVERIPGRSGLGVIVQVRHLELGQEVTLKFLVPDACAYPEFVQRFVREARAAVKIQGEHVARVTDVGRLESGAPYMVREYLAGPDLAEVVKVRGPLPIEEAVDYVIQAGEGVAEGHALGVVHRNLKPTSLVVTRGSDGNPLVKVFDFAAAESLHIDPFTERAISLVGTSAIMASLPYLAPEQIRDPHDVDFRADIYSLGAILFELLSGRPVYAAESAPGLLAMVAADTAPALRDFRPDLPGELDHIVLRCLAKNRAIRYPSMADLVLALKPFASPETNSSIERVVRLGKRTSRPPERAQAPAPALASVPPVQPISPFTPSPSAAPGALRGPTGTVIIREGVQATRTTAAHASPIGHEDVTTINPHAAYSAGSVTNPIVVEQPRYASKPPRMPTPTPPPLRASTPPPLRMPTPVPPPLSTRPDTRYESRPLPPPPPSSLPPRTSLSGLSRSWAVPDDVAPPIMTRKRLVAIGIVAACATLGGVLALRTASATRSGAPVAAARPVEAVPPPKVPAPPPVAPAAPPAVDLAAALPSAQVLAWQALAAAALQAQTQAMRSPAPVSAALAAPAPRAAAPAIRPARKPAPVEEAPSHPATEKLARAKPVPGPDLFDDPR